MTNVCRVGLCACLLAALLAAPHAAAAATCTWTGLGTDNNWSTAGNWDNCGGAHPTPLDTDSLVFPSGAARAVAVNDVVNLSVTSVKITGNPAAGSGNYDISGNGIVLVGGEFQFNAPAGTGPAFTAPVTLASASVVSNVGTVPARLHAIDLNGFSLTFSPGTANLIVTGPISGAGSIAKNGTQALFLQGANTFTGPMQINAGAVRVRNRTALGSPAAGTTVATGATLVVELGGGINEPLTLNGGTLATDGFGSEFSGYVWSGSITLTANSAINVMGLTALNVSGAIDGAFTLTVSGGGYLTLNGANPAFTGQTILQGGIVQVNGSLANSAISVTGGSIYGNGTVGTVTAAGGNFGVSGVLKTGDLTLSPAAKFALTLRGATPGLDYGQLRVTGAVNLANASLLPLLGALIPQNSLITLIDNDGTDPVVGTFAGLPEGATLTMGGAPNKPFAISYTGGTGNDVTLVPRFPMPYLLSEGATGGFFDEDILIANPNTVATPVSLTFLTPAGSPIVQTRTLPAQSRMTVHVDQIPGLEATEVSAMVTSTAALPLVVERSMFWDQSYYAGHTGSAVGEPSRSWIFAEGSQGFFHTYIQLANANDVPIEVTLTFLREAASPVVKTVNVPASARLTVDCGAIDELNSTSFGLTIFSGLPITAERAMYFGSTPTRLFSGGHESAGAPAPAQSWFFAEGATGGFFDTFVLLSNPQSTAASVTVRFLLDTGETVTETKTVPANGRLTINIEAEDDPRLKQATVSTVVTSDVPIVAERSMYWIGDVAPWTEGHNSFGVIEAGLHWGLAEGRLGGPLDFHTYIQLANPQSSAADVTVTYLREAGAPIVKTYNVPPTSRFNIDVNGVSPDMQNESIGADIRVTNGVPIIAERSMYWNSGGVFFKGGTNATGVRLP